MNPHERVRARLAQVVTRDMLNAAWAEARRIRAEGGNDSPALARVNALEQEFAQQERLALAASALCRCARCGAVRWWATFPCPGCEEAPTRAPGIPQAALDRTEHP
jgi:hypothetical protein